MQKVKKIGILGGMGPAASARFYQMLVKKCQEKYGAVQDEDYPEMVIYSIALEDFGERADVVQESVKNKLTDGVKTLESAGVDFIGIVCNTVHFYYQILQESVNIPILNLPEIAIEEVRKEGVTKVGIVCSEGTNQTRLYSHALETRGIEAISPNDEQQQILNAIIINVMSGRNNELDKDQLYSICESYEKEGAQAIILGCTELPLVVDSKKAKYNFFDTLDILADTALEKAYS